MTSKEPGYDAPAKVSTVCHGTAFYSQEFKTMETDKDNSKYTSLILDKFLLVSIPGPAVTRSFQISHFSNLDATTLFDMESSIK